jgi:hypothetical protein
MQAGGRVTERAAENPSRNGEGDHAKHGGGSRAGDHFIEVAMTGLRPFTTLRVVPLPAPGRI